MSLGCPSFWLALSFSYSFSCLSPMPEPTVPQERPQVPQISIKPEIVTKDASELVRDYIKPSLIRYPMYNYKTGNTWFLSKTQQIVVDAYLESNNESEARRSLNRIRAAHGSTKMYSQKAVSSWLRKPHVALYIADQQIDRGKVNWFNVAKWEAWGVDVMQGKTPATQVQVAVWKEFGKAKGWFKDTGPQVMHNTQINFVQSDGRA